MPLASSRRRRRPTTPLVRGPAPTAARSSSSPATSTPCPRTGTSPGGIEDGRRARARRERHEGRARGDDRARPRARGRGRARVDRLPLLPARGARRRGQPAAGVLRRPAPSTTRRWWSCSSRPTTSSRSAASGTSARVSASRAAAPTRRGRGSARTRSTAPSRGSRRSPGWRRTTSRSTASPFREVLSLTRISGGRADNVVPDLVDGDAQLPLRAAANAARRPRRASRELAGERGRDHEPLAGRVRSPSRTRSCSGCATEGELAVTPKQAWTPVAQFAERGLDAVNFGPGATRLRAHARRADRGRRARALASRLSAAWSRSVSRVHVSPVLAAQTDVPVRPDRGGEAPQGGRGRPHLRLRDGRSARADRPADQARARRRRSTRRAATRRAVGLPELRDAIAALGGAALRRRARPGDAS